MPAFPADAVARFEEVLRKDPNSQVFAPLADAYRSENRLAEADRVSSDGVRRHAGFAGGWVIRGRVLRDLKRPEEAREALLRAIRLAPENLLALQILGEVLLELKEPKEALRIFKRVLFLNPQAEKAKRIVAKLESLTADEYEDELFSMTRLRPLQETPRATAPTANEVALKPGEPPKGLVRLLSLVDAFIVRNDIVRAAQLLDETQVEFGAHGEIDQRRILLQRRRGLQLSESAERPEALTPLVSREEAVRAKKVETLRSLLRTIDELKDAPLTS